MDPLVNIISDLYDWIFLHFNGKDFTETTTVSPFWNATLENSKVVMENVKLSLKIFYWPSYTETEIREIEMIKNTSTRHYRNVSVNFGYIPQKLSLNFAEYLVNLAPSLLELEIRQLDETQETIGKLLDKMDLSKLKVLKLQDTTAGAINRLLNRCHSLTKLELKTLVKSLLNFESRPIPILQLIPFLMRNKSLQDVELAGFEFYKVFFEAGTSETVRMKLRRLKLEPLYSRRFQDAEAIDLMPEDIERQFVEFLVTQSEHLECLHVNNVRSSTIEHFINRMSELTSLSINWVTAKEAQLNLNEKIVELSIGSYDSPISFINLLQDLPNLKKLTLGALKNQALLKFIAKNSQQLCTLRIDDSGFKTDDPIWTSLWPDAVPFYDKTRKITWSLKR